MTDHAWELLYARDDLDSSELRVVEPVDLRPGFVRLAVERFSLTLNNVTYARLGDSPAPFWDAFPAPAGYGRLPVWGFATVAESAHPDIAEGSRWFGWMPSSSHFTVPAELLPHGFFRDSSKHRDTLHDWYRTFRPAPASPDGLDDHRTVIRPLFPAAYQLAAFAGRQEGAGSLLVTSGSSKTALSLASQLAKGPHLPAAALTSPGHVGLVESFGVYETVTTYDALSSLELPGPVVVVDFAGDPDQLAAIYRRFEGRLAAVALVGYTHKAEGPPEGLTNPEPMNFFTPEVEDEAVAAEGAESYYARYDVAEEEYVASTTSWLKIQNQQGPEAVRRVFTALQAGEQAPDVADVLTP